MVNRHIKKLLKNSNNQRNANANENNNEISPHTYQNCITKRSTISNVADDVEKREFLYAACGNVHWCNHYEKLYGFSLKS